MPPHVPHRPPPNVHLTPTQLAKQAERKAAKLARKAALAAAGGEEAGKRRILAREWIRVGPSAEGKRTARIVTWNMLAQTLVRRELFPGSDCLRWGDRRPMLQAEMARQADVDVICLQECDRLDDMLDSVPDHAALSAKGRGKLHGLVVLYKKTRFGVRAQRALPLDDELLSPEKETDVARRGVSRQTRNMALIVALEEKAQEGKEGSGLLVITTHLFWHPKYEYERARQIIVLLRAVKKLQEEEGCEAWPVVFAGDLNTEPDELTYQLLAAPNDAVDPAMVDYFNASRLVHHNVVNVGLPLPETEPSSEAASAEGSGTSTPVGHHCTADEDELPDTHEASLAGTRVPRPADGILEYDEIVAAAKQLLPEPARSAYGTKEWGTETFEARGGFPEGVKAASGGGEPGYTCFTPKFHLTLDYLFLLPFGTARAEFTRLIKPPPTAELGAGLPLKGISASDHLTVGCEIEW